MGDLIKIILKDLKVELLDKFDSNFSRGAFFGKKWKPRRDGIPTHLNNTGTLRRSISAKVHGHSLTFTSSTPYSAIHNDGGIIYVRPHHRHFWCKVDGKRKKVRKQVKSYNYRMPKRQFLGAYPGIDKTIERAAKHAIQQELQKIATKTKN